MSVALTRYLQPISEFLDMDGVNEVCINRPGEVWVERFGVFESKNVPTLTLEHLKQLAGLVAEFNSRSKNSPLISATLPDGERCQFVMPPICEAGQFVVSIRKPSVIELSIEDWVEKGAFKKTNQAIQKQSRFIRLQQLFDEGRWEEFFKEAVIQRLNILVSAGTGTGKTTFLNSILRLVPASQRLISVEDQREIKVHQPNAAHLLDDEKGACGEKITQLDLIKACFRLRPDRIFVSELRSGEAYPFLRGCISGHPGSLSTLHADSIESAKEQLQFMLTESNELANASESRLKGLINQAVDIFVQMERDNDERLISNVELNIEGKL